MKETNNEAKEKISLAKELFDIFEILVIAACVVLLLYSFICRLCVVSGNSMDTTLAHGQMLAVSNIGYTPVRGDIIVFHQTSDEIVGLNEPIVKRVIATAGETVNIDFDTWTVKITDKDGNTDVLDESGYMYLKEGYAITTWDWDGPVIVPDGYLFVMGDNRNHSTDSRSTYIGLVDTRRVIGKAIFRLSPFEKFGKLDLEKVKNAD
ncbi:MAG: signal peptidase I [Clostridia bacterium]|nr:signal peptidase I [Clostridia bacterium]